MILYIICLDFLLVVKHEIKKINLKVDYMINKIDNNKSRTDQFIQIFNLNFSFKYIKSGFFATNLSNLSFLVYIISCC